MMMSEGDITVRTTVQSAGMLYKKPFGHASSKWSKRFFVLKDGYLLYYGDKEEKQFKATGLFNIHPKGCIPIGGCTVTKHEDKDQLFALQIAHPDFSGPVMLASETEQARDDWCKAIQDSSKVSFKNAQIGETMIACLKAKSEVISEQKNQFKEKLQEESQALETEKQERERVEQQLAQLMAERDSALKAIADLEAERQRKQAEIQKTQEVIEQIEAKKAELEDKARTLEVTLVEVSSKTTETEKVATQHEEEAKRLAQEKQALEDATARLAESLKKIQQHAEDLMSEKAATETRLREAESSVVQIAGALETATKVKETLEVELGVTAQEKEKAMSLAEREKEERERAVSLAEQEREEREKAERKLRVAEEALIRLDKALRKTGVKVDVEVFTDVKNLKSFFEDALDDAHFQAYKPKIMEDAVNARVMYKKQDGATPVAPPRRARPSSTLVTAGVTPILAPAPTSPSATAPSPSVPATPTTPAIPAASGYVSDETEEPYKSGED